jgi:hypothetical protein
LSYRQAAAHTLSQLKEMRLAADKHDAIDRLNLLKIQHAAYGAFKAKNGSSYFNQMERELKKQAGLI